MYFEKICRFSSTFCPNQVINEHKSFLTVVQITKQKWKYHVKIMIVRVWTFLRITEEASIDKDMLLIRSI